MQASKLEIKLFVTFKVSRFFRELKSGGSCLRRLPYKDSSFNLRN